MFVWLFPAENALGVQGLLIVPAILGGLLALVPILDRSPYLSPSRRKALIISAALILIVIVASGVIFTLQPIAGGHLMQ